MDRRSFIKGLIALASAPAIGKYVNIFKTEGAREGIEQVAGQGVDFFNMVIKKVMDEGTLVKEQDRISTFKHPDRPDIVVDVDQTTGSSSVFFEADSGTKSMAEITKTADETTKGRTVEELFEQEEIYGPTGREAQEGISGGITNLEEFIKMKRGFAAGGRVAPSDRENNYLGYRPEDFNEKLGIFADGTKLYATPQAMPMGLGIPPSSNYADNTNNTNNANNIKRRQNVTQAMMSARIPQETIDEALGELGLKNGGRVGMFRGGIPKGLQVALRGIMSKYGDDAITTADRAPQPAKTTQEEIMDFQTRNPNPKRLLTDDEIRDYEEVLGDTEYWMMDGTVGEAEEALRQSKEYEAAMFREYKAGKLDPEPGEVSRGRLQKLQEKLEEMEMTGDKRLMTPDEMEELMFLEKKFAKEALDAKAQGTRKMSDEEIAELKALSDMGYKDGGLVNLTAIKIPDISESGVESLFKRR